MDNMKKETENEITQEPTLTLGQSINFKQLFRCKGHRGIYFPLSKPNKSTMVGMSEFMGSKTITVHMGSTECLGDIVFFKKDGGQITFSEAFDNTDKIEIEMLQTLKEFRNIICPDYDEDKFKEYHAKKFMDWYYEIKTKIENNSDDQKKESKD